MKCGIVVFPGSNCDHDCYHILKHILNQETHWLWHKEEANLESFDLVVLPGGFSYGDYLRAGAIARFSPIMNSIIRFAKKGGKVLGICNGFQILLECGLLPGVLIQNQSRKFICKNVFVCIDNPDTAFTQDCGEKNVLEIPIAHHQGSYYIDPYSLSQLEENFFTPGIGHFQTKALLIPGAKVGQVSTLVPPFFAGLPAGERAGLTVLQVDHAFHADDLGAQIR